MNWPSKAATRFVDAAACWLGGSTCFSVIVVFRAAFTLADFRVLVIVTVVQFSLPKIIYVLFVSV